jgi:hypothetical protein
MSSIQNPFLPMPTAAKAWAEGFTKGFLATSSPEPSENVAAEDVDAFNQGVATGEQSAREGISLGDPCIPALEEHGPLHVPGMALNGVEIAHGAWELRHFATLAGGVAGIVLALVELSCTLPVHTLPPEQVLPRLGQPIMGTLSAYGLNSMELFCGARLDAAAEDCEIRVTPLFPSLGQARENAVAMARNEWVVVSWRTDQCGSFRVVDAS